MLKCDSRCCVLVGSFLFFVSLALEWNVNLFRTICLCTVLVAIWKEPFFRDMISKSKQLYTSLLFPVIAFFSFVTGPYGTGGLKTFDWVIYLLIGITISLSSKKDIKILLTIPLVCVCFSLLIIFFQWIVNGNIDMLFQHDMKMKIYNESANRMGFVLSLSAAIVFGFFPLLRKYTWSLLILLLITTMLCWFTQSRSAIFALVGTAGVVFIFFIRSELKQGIIILTFFLLVIGGAFFYIGGERITQTVYRGSWDFLLNGRGDIWEAAWEIFQKYPIVGGGVDSFRDALECHLNLLENAGRFPDIRSQYIFWNAHQMILGILCETGIAGLIIFILLIYRSIRDGIKNYPETFPALLMLVDFLIAGIGGYGFHRSWNSAFFFLAIGLIEGLRLRKNSLIRQPPAQHDQPCGAQAE